MTMDSEEIHGIIQAYNIPINASTLRSAAEDEEQWRLLTEWTKSHLTPDTLLTKDELNSYISLERNGRAETLAASADLSTILPLSDEGLRHAVEQLNRSTQLINKQTESLLQQQDALARLVSTSGKNGTARATLEVKRLQKWASDRKALQTAIDLLSQGLSYRVSEIELQNTASGEEATALIGTMLACDDKLLASLQKLGLELATEDSEEAESIDNLREICARLIKYTVECLRTKLDRTFLETLESCDQSKDKCQVPKDDIIAQQEELEELYSEILAVAQMSVEQQWLEPSLRSLSNKNGNSLSRSADALKYVLDCFHYLLDRTDRACDRIASAKAHEQASATVVATAKNELSSVVAAPAERRGNVSSPSRRPRSLMLDSLMTSTPSRSFTPTKQSRRRSSGDAFKDTSLQQLLGDLALDLPSFADTTSGTNLGHAQTSYLHNSLRVRADKSSDVARAVQTSLERASSGRLVDMRAATQLVRDSLLAESPFAEVRLVDPGIEASISVLAQEAQNVAGRLASVEREAAVLGKGRNTQREEFVKRWARRGAVRP